MSLLDAQEVSWGTVLDLFLLALVAALVAGATCPLVGNFLYLRRTSFYGLVLPQLAACGIAFGFFALPWWVEHVGLGGMDVATALEDSHAALGYHMAWAAVFTFGGLAALTLGPRRGQGEVGHLAAAFALASALTILFAHASPAGEIFVHDLLRGEILAIGPHELEGLVAGLGLAAGAVVLFRRDLLVVCYDREAALVLGKPVVAYELLLVVATGLTVSVGVLSVGPVVLFGLLVLPPIAARTLARSMGAFHLLSSGLGLGAALLGIWASFRFDWPLGPTVVVAAAGEWAVCAGLARLRR